MKRGLFVFWMILLPLLAVPLSAGGQAPSLSGEKWTGKLAKLHAPLPTPKSSLNKISASSALNTGTRLTTSDKYYSRGPTRWSPDGKWIAYEQEGDIFVVSPPGWCAEEPDRRHRRVLLRPIVHSGRDGDDFHLV